MDEHSTGVRTLVIGLDGVNADVLSRISDDRIPTIQSILEDAATGPLESQLPPWTPSAWPSMYTGVNPGKHGVYGFLRFEGYDWDVVNFTDVREQTVWELLDRHGISSAVVNVPVTHPPAEFNGALIPGYTAPEDPDCHPSGLLEDVRDEIGEYRVYNDQMSEATTSAERAESYEELTRMRGDAFRYVVDRFDPEFGFLQFQQTDTVFHEFPEDDDVVDRVFGAVDDQIEATLEACDPDYVFIVSDHGIGPYDGWEFRANSFLRDEGYVETTVGGDGKPSWSTIASNNRQQDEANSNSNSSSVLERSLSAAAKVGFTSQRLGSILERLRLDDVILKAIPAGIVRAASEHADFAESTAYFRDRIELGVRINLVGREPNGTVTPAEYERVRSSLIDQLETVRTPDGEPVFDDVMAREMVYHGPYLEDAPDIVVVPNDFNQFLSSSIRDPVFDEPQESWNHKLQGIVAVTGPDVKSTALRSAHLLDVAPSILSTLGVPTSDRMDGSALPVIEPTETESYPEYAEEEIVATEDEQVEQQLADLGYIE